MSIVKETNKALKETWTALVPAFVALSVVLAFLSIAMPQISKVSLPITDKCRIEDNFQGCFDEHKEEIKIEKTEALKIFLKELIPFAACYMAMLIATFMYFYYVSIAYMKQEMEYPPEISFRGFRHYTGCVIWKYLHPVFWNVIPVLGQIMYVRSLIRYELVGPFALMEKGDELKASWEMTEGKALRIFGASVSLIFLYTIPLMLLSFMVAIATAVAIGITAGREGQYGFLHFLLAIITAGFQTLLYTVRALMPFAVYRVIIEEANAQKTEMLT